MQQLATILVLFVAVSHIGILILEMFFWDHPVGREVFSMTAEQSANSAILALNQGLYNGFLAAGLIWTFFITNQIWQVNIALFFLGCVSIAGIYGTLTADKKIFMIQALPAIIGIVLILINY